MQWLRGPAGLQKHFVAIERHKFFGKRLRMCTVISTMWLLLMQSRPQCEVLECAFVSLRLQDHRGRAVLGSNVEAEVA